ncbi:MAG TPA: DUF2778 domain-containing protein [Pseudolabrys sp.]|nr:DUF2778 domain-containing protein [Pseudolabrys sp.]
MARAVATVREVPGFDRRVLFQADTGRINRTARVVAGSAVTAAAAAAAVGVFGFAVTLGAAFILNTGLAGNPHLRAPGLGGPAALALVEPTPVTAAPVTFEGKWAHVVAEMRFRPVSPQLIARLNRMPVHDSGRGLVRVAQLTAPPPRIALPLPRPHIEPPVGQAAPRLAMALPLAAAIAEKPLQLAHKKPPELPTADGRTAVYDISAHTVYLPNGERLEAHSGLGDKMDNPQYTKVRMRGATPPNVYSLTLREEIFHGVRAIRLNPIDEDKMYGRAGILAHTYMLGPNGQSNGCVSFRDYDKFLRAFLKGQVDRMVVVAALPRPPRMASMRRDHAERYAAND